MAQTFPNLIKNTNSQIQKAQQIPYKRQRGSRHVIVKSWEKNLERVRENKHSIEENKNDYWFVMTNHAGNKKIEQ